MKQITQITMLMLLLLVSIKLTAGTYSGGTGTSGDPYQIATLADLIELSGTTADWASTKYFIQTADIDATSTTTLNAGAGFSPIGNGTTSFQGSYNGQYHKIINLFINRTTSNIGLFGYIFGVGDRVKNLGLLNANITGAGVVGGLAGSNTKGTISNCFTTGTINGSGIWTGGLIGLNTGGTIKYCFSTANVSGSESVGGLVGENMNSTITSDINFCFATGSVTGSYKTGGFAGSVDEGYITNCFATGNVSGSNFSSGGFIGSCDEFDGYLSNCYSTGSVIYSSYNGGFIGYYDGEYYFIVGCFWDTQTSGMTTSAGGYGITGKTTAQMKTQSTFTDWDFTAGNDNWTMSSPITYAGYPTLQWTGGYSVAPTNTPKEIASLPNLVWLSEAYSISPTAPTRWSGAYIQTANINAWTTPSWDGKKGWIPIGNLANAAFTGTYDGQNKTISNLYSNRATNYNGLFGFVSGSGEKTKNIGLVNVNISGGNYTGALAGKLAYCTTTNCYSSGIVSGSIRTGGLIGVADGAPLSNCNSNGKVSGTSSVGGLVGYIEASGLSNSYSTANVTATDEFSYAGGLIGFCYMTSPSNCYAKGNVEGKTGVGGFVGITNDSGNNISSCFSTGNVGGVSKVGGFIGIHGTNFMVTIANCYSLGNVTRISGTDTQFGGFCGYFQGVGSISNCYSVGLVNFGTSQGFNGTNSGTNSNNYFDATTSGQTSGYGATAKTTAQMKTQSTFTTSPSNWDFTANTGVWKIQSGSYVSYPYLQAITYDAPGVSPEVNPIPGLEVGKPDNPSSFAATASSSTQIGLGWALNGNSNDVMLGFNTTDTFGDPTETYIAGDPITGGGTVLYVGTNTSFNHTPLSVNTHYYYKIWSTDGTDYSDGASDDKWTLANVPSVPTVNIPNYISLDVAVNANGNPAVTEFAIHETSTNKFVQSDGTLGATAVWATATTWGTKTVTGLASNTQYTFEVKARNGGNVETAYSASASGTTLECFAGDTWTAQTAAEANAWQAVTSGGGKFVAVANNGTNRAMTSTDGINWTAQSLTSASQWKSITYGNSLFLAVGSDKVARSADGLSWEVSNSNYSITLYSVTYGNGLFVAVGSQMINRIIASSDGVTWEGRGGINGLQAVTYGNGVFVAVGPNNEIQRSTNGTTWTTHSITGDGSWQSVTYGNGKFVAVSNSGTNRVMTSTDGITWTNQTAPEYLWTSITYGNGKYVAVSSAGYTQLMTSTNGVNWIDEYFIDANAWRGITFGNGAFVAVSSDGTNRVVTSECVAPAITVTTHAVSAITATSATGNGNITNIGSGNATNRGVIYYPYTNTDKEILGVDVINVSEPGDFGTGTFTASLTGLSVNTRYNARAHATNAGDGTKYGDKVDFWTLANVPSAPTVNNATATTLDVSINSNSNPAITEFAIHETSTDKFVQANGSLGATAVWATAATWATKTVTGLTTGTEYTFEVKARNGGNVETAYGTTATGTPEATPTVTTHAASAITATSATGNGNITATNGVSPTNRGVIYYEYTNTDLAIGGTGVTNVDENGSPTFSTGAFTRSLTGLSVNTRYNARAHATNTVGTGYGSRVDFWTLANVPSAPTVNNATATTLDIAVNANSNPAITEFVIHETTTNKYVQADGTLGATAVWATAATLGTKTVTGLTTGTEYTFEVKARNGGNVETAYGTTATSTPEAAPTVTTHAASAITATSATGNGNITATNGVSPTNRGVIYYEYTNTDLLIGGAGVTNVDENGAPTFSTGAFTRSLTGLSVNTRYNARAHATNSVGTGYGSRVDFWTLANVPGKPVLDGVTASSFDVTLDVNSNSSITEFTIRVKFLDGVNPITKYVNHTTGNLQDAADWQTNATWATKTVSGLDVGKEYTVDVKARSNATPQVETAFGDEETVVTCKNPDLAGEIAADQTICYNTTPVTFTSVSPATGFGGTLEYKWQKSTTSEVAGFTDIASSNSATYSAGALSQTTWYKRLARVDCKPDWTGAVATNVVKITVDHTPPSATAKNNTIFLDPFGQYSLTYTEVLSAWSDIETGVNLAEIMMNPQNFTCAHLGQTIPVTVTVPDMCGNETTVTSNITVLEGNALLPPWLSCNTSPAANGSSTYSPCTNNGTFYLTSKGLSTTTNDVMHFVYQPLTGNGTIITRIADVKNDGWAGVMMRESCDPNAKTILFKTRLYNPTVIIGTRTTTGKSITNTSQSQPNLRWMKIQRNGSTFQVFVSANGTSWTRVYTATIAMNNTLLVGIFTDNYTSSKTTQAWFDNVDFSNTLKLGDLSAEAAIINAETGNPDVLIYPNPADDEMNIILPGWATCKASLFSAEGKVLKTFTISTIETKLDVQDLKPGLYILRFESAEDIVIKRLVIQ